MKDMSISVNFTSRELESLAMHQVVWIQ